MFSLTVALFFAAAGGVFAASTGTITDAGNAVAIIGATAAAPIPAPSGGLGVAPGELTVKEVPAGKKVLISSLGAEKLKVTNKDSRPHRFTIKVLTCAESQNRVKYGYQDIPDIAWLKPAEAEAVIGPMETKEFDLFAAVPKKAEYRGKSFQAIVEVRREKDNPTDLFVLAAQPRVCFTMKE